MSFHPFLMAIRENAPRKHGLYRIYLVGTAGAVFGRLDGGLGTGVLSKHSTLQVDCGGTCASHCTRKCVGGGLLIVLLA